jgi:hypothetical protein
MKSIKLMSLYVCEESSGFLYAGSRQHFCILTDMCQKPSAYFGLCIGMVPKAYHWQDGDEEDRDDKEDFVGLD